MKFTIAVEFMSTHLFNSFDSFFSEPDSLLSLLIQLASCFDGDLYCAKLLLFSHCAYASVWLLVLNSLIV